MQTFLPYPDFKKSLQTLDYRRLGKQRIEAYQIIFLFHPWAFESFDHDRILARILHGMSFFINQEIEECFQLGISQSPG